MRLPVQVQLLERQLRANLEAEESFARVRGEEQEAQKMTHQGRTQLEKQKWGGKL